MLFKGHIKYIKTAALILAAAVYVPFVASWCEPGIALHNATVALGGAPGSVTAPFWSMLVRLVGRDVQGIGTLSMIAALLCAGILATITSDLYTAAVHKALKSGRRDGDFVHLRSVAVLLTVGAFVFTPGFFRAATRVGPLLSLLVPGLLALAVLTRIVLGFTPNLLVILKLNGWRIFWLIVLSVYAVWEALHCRRLLLGAWPAFLCFALVGVLPMLVLAELTRRRKLTRRASRRWVVCVWTIAVAVCAVLSLMGRNRGRTASHVVERILVNAGSCRAVVSDGPLDDLFYFMLPENKRLIALSRDREPKYGRDLAAWIDMHEFGGEKREELVFAAELGPKALLEDWGRLDAAGCRAVICRLEGYFPTAEQWREACGLLKEMPEDETYGAFVKRLLCLCGNQLGCKLLEEKDLIGAWNAFWGVLKLVDAQNYAALVNLSGMVERGYAASKKDKAQLKALREAVEGKLKTREERMLAAVLGGRLYVDAEAKARYERMKREALARMELSKEAKAFIETVSAAPKSRQSAKKAQDAIRKGIKDGLVRADRIGTQLLTVDRFLDDWDGAETDAIDVLRLDRSHMTANAVMGTMAGFRGDYKASERYLRRALGSGKAETAVANDLAVTLVQLGRAQEAEPLARQAVLARPDDWNFRETLARTLIRCGKADEGERELQQAMEQCGKAGQKPEHVLRFELNRAWLLLTRKDLEKTKVVLRKIESRDDLMRVQRAELLELRKALEKAHMEKVGEVSR